MSHPLKTDVTERVVRQTIDQLTRRVDRRLREMNIFQDDLADRMGILRPSVSRAINGKEITVAMFDRLTKALEVDAEWWTQPIGRTFKRPDAFAVLMAKVREIARRYEKN